MGNFNFRSLYQKRYENGQLVSVSRAEYNFQNIPMGDGDKNSLNNMVVNVVVERITSFEAVKQSVNNEIYCFKDRSECIDVIYTLDNDSKEIRSIVFNRLDLNTRFEFLESDKGEDVPESLVVDNISSWLEMSMVYPERTYNDSKLEDEIDTFENRVETAQEYLEDEDDPYVRSVLVSRLYSYRQTLSKLLAEKQRRGI